LLERVSWDKALAHGRTIYGTGTGADAVS
jgi:hypothetical protein